MFTNVELLLGFGYTFQKSTYLVHDKNEDVVWPEKWDVFTGPKNNQVLQEK